MRRAGVTALCLLLLSPLSTADEADPTDPVAALMAANGHDVRKIVPHEIPDDVDPTRTIVFCIGSAPEFAGDEPSRYDAFMRAGGTVVIASDSGFAGGFVSAYGIRFIPGDLRDDRKGANATPGDYVSVTGRVGTDELLLIFIAPAALADVDPDAQRQKILALSTQQSYLDANSNGARDPGERAGPFAVAVQAPVGKGRLIVFSDFTWLTGDGLHLGANSDFFLGTVINTNATSGDRWFLIDDGSKGKKTPGAGLLIAAAALLVAVWRRSKV